MAAGEIKFESVILRPLVVSCVGAEPRHADGPQTFDEALKELGHNELARRQWIARTIDEEEMPGSLSRNIFWMPSSGGYVAIGGAHGEAVERFVSVGATSIEFHRRRTVYFAGAGAVSDGRTVHRPARSATCPTCYVELPSSGVCDDCG